MNATTNPNGKMIDTDTMVGGYWVEPKVGSYVVLDGKNVGELLLPGDDYVDSGFPGCAFRYPCPIWGEKRAIAVNVTVTGRTSQHKHGARMVRVIFEWVGDCEPSTYSRGWMKV